MMLLTIILVVPVVLAQGQRNADASNNPARAPESGASINIQQGVDSAVQNLVSGQGGDANGLGGLAQGLAPLISVVPGILESIISRRLNRPRYTTYMIIFKQDLIHTSTFGV